MIAAQRHQMILETVRAEGAASIKTLTARLGTSAVTIRRDLDHLDTAGLLTRTHGGAVAGLPSRESTYTEKATQAPAEKQAIGRVAATLVRDGDVVIIGPGTTTEALAMSLRERTGLTIITNSLLVVQALVGSPENQVIMTGGTLRAPILALVGESASRTLRGIHANTTFLSGNGLVADFGLSTPNMAVADTDRAMVAAGTQLVVLADHTKLGRRTAIQTVPPEGITHLVTDEGSPAAELGLLTARGVTVHVAGTGVDLSDTI